MYKFRGIAAGMMIGMAAMLNLQIGGILGACFFSLGLLAVCALQLDLFTGKIGAIMRKEITLWQATFVFLMNLVGILIIATISFAVPKFDAIKQAAQELMEGRQALPFIAIFTRGILCGICVQMAVDMYKALRHPFSAMLPIAAFVILGGCHCIADFFYWIIGGANWQIFQILYAALGNIIGAALFSLASQGIRLPFLLDKPAHSSDPPD